MAIGRVSTNGYATARFIVDTNGISTGATHSTIAAALADAVSGQSIFIRPGTYTENLTLKAGVDLVSYDADALTPNVTIVGKATATFAGTCSITGIRLQTNSDYALSVTGNSATAINLKSCYINCTNNTGVQYTSSSAGSVIYFYDCVADLTTTGIAFFAASGVGGMVFYRSLINNGGASSTASTTSACPIQFYWSWFLSPISTSSSGWLTAKWSTFSCLDVTPLTLNNSPENNFFAFCHIASGTAASINITAGNTSIHDCEVFSSNANPVTGSAILTLGPITFTTTGLGINTTSVVPYTTKLGNLVSLSSTSGASISNSVIHTSNTASSTAFHNAQVAGGTASDAYYKAEIASGQAWTWGLDNSDSDAYVLSASATPGTTNVMRVSTAGEVNFPLTPAFHAYNSSTDSNVTGDGTVYTIICDTEVYDQNADYNNSTGVFTAPVAGRYAFSGAITLLELGAGHTAGGYSFATTGSNIANWAANPAAMRDTGNAIVVNIAAYCNMAASDTASCAVSIANSTKTVDVLGTGSSAATWFAGFLIC